MQNKTPGMNRNRPESAPAATPAADLAGHVAIVTGASGGIGRAIALELGAQGASVVVNYRSDEAAALEVVREIGVASAVAVQGDVGDLGSHARLVSAALDRFGRIDTLVNNAGIGVRQPFLETTPESWDAVMSVNLKGAYFLAQAASRVMVPRQAGRIINISSVHETRAMAGNSAYCISKAGLEMLTKSLALELAPHGIAVIGVSPGAIHTEATRVVLEDPAYRARTLEKIPVRRIGEASDVAAAVAWLASPRCRYVTGATLTIDGGMLLQ